MLDYSSTPLAFVQDLTTIIRKFFYILFSPIYLLYGVYISLQAATFGSPQMVRRSVAQAASFYCG